MTTDDEQRRAQRDPATRIDRGRSLRHLVLLAIVLASGALCRWGSNDASPLDDEWAHLYRGTALWSTWDTAQSYDVPPLADAVTTVGLARRGALPPLAAGVPGDAPLDVARDTYRSVRADYPASRAALLRARDAATWFLLAGIVYVYGWALRFCGWPTAVAAAVLIGFNPVLLGRAAFVGHDVPSAVTMVVVVGELARLVIGDGGRWTRYGTLPLAIGAALLTSHRAWVLVPIIAVVICVEAWPSIVRAAAHLSATAAIVVVLVNLGYGARDTGMTVGAILERPEPHSEISAPYRHEMLELATPLSALPRSLRIPLPYTMVFGLGSAIAQTRDGDRRATFWGHRNRHGHALFFPALLLFKTPLPVLALVLGGLPMARIRGLGRRGVAAAIVGATAVVCLSLAMRWAPNLGIGGVLHIEMLLCVLAAIVFGAAWRARARTLPRVGLATLLCLACAVGFGAGPRHRGYFNPLLGRAAGPRLSAVGDDAGQGTAALAPVVAAVSYAPWYVHHGSWAAVLELGDLGVRHTPLRCKTRLPGGVYVAIHRARVQTAPWRCFRWRYDRAGVLRQPAWVVADNIEVYWLPHDERPPRKRR